LRTRDVRPGERSAASYLDEVASSHAALYEEHCIEAFRILIILERICIRPDCR